MHQPALMRPRPSGSRVTCVTPAAGTVAARRPDAPQLPSALAKARSRTARSAPAPRPSRTRRTGRPGATIDSAAPRDPPGGGALAELPDPQELGPGLGRRRGGHVGPLEDAHGGGREQPPG